MTENGSTWQLEQWRDVFMRPLEAEGIKVYPCRGNHDAGAVSRWTSVFTGAYALPQNGPDGQKGVTYSFEHKSAFIATADQFMTWPWGDFDRGWLQKRLAETKQPHTFVFGHYPLETLDDHYFYSEIGVESRFAGHWHYFVHFAADVLPGKHDVHEYVCGVAGGVQARDIWNDPESSNEYVASHTAGYGYLLVEIDGYEATTVYKKRIAPGVYEEAVPRYTHSRTFLLAPTARFEADAQAGPGELDVAFRDTSTCPAGTISSWLWNFGDGATSMDQHPEHTYAAPGLYEVSLTVTNECGSATTRQAVFTGGQEVPAVSVPGLVVAMALILVGTCRGVSCVSTALRTGSASRMRTHL